MGRDRAAKISREKDGAERRGARNGVECCARQFDDTEADGYVNRVSELGERLDDRRRLQDMKDGIEYHEENDDGAENAAWPRNRLGRMIYKLCCLHG